MQSRAKELIAYIQDQRTSQVMRVNLAKALGEVGNDSQLVKAANNTKTGFMVPNSADRDAADILFAKQNHELFAALRQFRPK